MELQEIWRYPLKSAQGERLSASALSARGVDGDRGWAVRDEVRGGIRGAKKITQLMTLGARYLSPPAAEPPHPEILITLPDGREVRSDQDDASTLLSESLEHEVTLWPLLPASDLEHYRRGRRDHEDIDAELRDVFARTKDEPLPDLSEFPPEVRDFETPPGTYFDASPILLVTRQSLEQLERVLPKSRVDVRRFRPNLVVDADGRGGFAEAGWRGREIRIGQARLRAGLPCPRCKMITLPFDDLARDTDLMRAVVQSADQCLGIYAEVLEGGAIEVGQSVELS